MTSPISSTRRNSRRIAPSNTLNTITSTNTTIPETSSHPAAVRRHRLSFLKRNNPEAKEAVATSFTNGNTPESPLRVVQGSPNNERVTRERTPTTSTRTRSRSPTTTPYVNGVNKRASYFSRTNANGNGTGGEKDESMWVTSSDLNSLSRYDHERTGTATTRRSDSRSFTRTSREGSTGNGNGRGDNLGGNGGNGSVGSGVGSVRKRLSLLKLGKKGSKGTLLMGGVREED
jgi:dedicator of cytokinesis protein 3